MGEVAPLSTLLARAWAANAIEVDNAFEAETRPRGRWLRISVAMWSNGLRCIDSDGTAVEVLQSATRAKCNLGGLERWGWIHVGEQGQDRRKGYGSHRGIKSDTVLTPTKGGTLARRIWPEVIAQVEQRWRDRFGGTVIDGLHHVLIKESQPRLPWSPPEVNPSDGFRTKIVDGDGSTDVDLPLIALLGQAMSGLTERLESDAVTTLPMAFNVLRIIEGHQPAAMGDLPAFSGISKEAVAMAMTNLKRCGWVALDQRSVSITAAGQLALAQIADRADATDSSPLRKALGALLDQTEALSAGLAPPDGCWRGQGPYLKQTKRLLADPMGALPWQPMVLHRGGWPDGS